MGIRSLAGLAQPDEYDWQTAAAKMSPFPAAPEPVLARPGGRAGDRAPPVVAAAGAKVNHYKGVDRRRGSSGGGGGGKDNGHMINDVPSSVKGLLIRSSGGGGCGAKQRRRLRDEDARVRPADEFGENGRRAPKSSGERDITTGTDGADRHLQADWRGRIRVQIANQLSAAPMLASGPPSAGNLNISANGSGSGAEPVAARVAKSAMHDTRQGAERGALSDSSGSTSDDERETTESSEIINESDAAAADDDRLGGSARRKLKRPAQLIKRNEKPRTGHDVNAIGIGIGIGLFSDKSNNNEISIGSKPRQSQLRRQQQQSRRRLITQLVTSGGSGGDSSRGLLVSRRESSAGRAAEIETATGAAKRKRGADGPAATNAIGAAEGRTRPAPGGSIGPQEESMASGSGVEEDARTINTMTSDDEARKSTSSPSPLSSAVETTAFELDEPQSSTTGTLTAETADRMGIGIGIGSRRRRRRHASRAGKAAGEPASRRQRRQQTLNTLTYTYSDVINATATVQDGDTGDSEIANNSGAAGKRARARSHGKRSSDGDGDGDRDRDRDRAGFGASSGAVTFDGAAPSKRTNDRHIMCRVEKNEYLDFEQYSLFTCANCYA